MFLKVLHKTGTSEKCFVFFLPSSGQTRQKKVLTCLLFNHFHWLHCPCIPISVSAQLCVEEVQKPQDKIHTPKYYIKSLCDLVLLTSPPDFPLFPDLECMIWVAWVFLKSKWAFSFSDYRINKRSLYKTLNNIGKT